MKKADRERYGYGLLMSLFLSVKLMAGGGPALAQTGTGNESGQQPRISVWIYNYAQVSRKTLDEAEGISETILAKAGIQISWCNWPAPACAQSLGPASLVVNILPKSMAARLPNGDDDAGFAVVLPETRPSARAGVFYLRVTTIAGNLGYSAGGTRGSVIAHEIGHLLLETNGHASTGIMQARWTPEDLRHAACGQLLFTPRQAEQMRRGVRERAQIEAAAELATAMASK